MYDFDTLLRLVPKAPDWSISWEQTADMPLSSYICDMARTPQNPAYHGEGDVWTHTRMVCQALAEDTAFRGLIEPRRQALFLAALLHDLGKTVCTRWEDERWTSPNHSSVGAGIARRLLWQDYGLCGSPEKQQMRETICNLIRYHSVPANIITDPEGLRRLRRIAANDLLMPHFSLEMLYLLARADGRGRVCRDRDELIYRTDLFRELALDGNCYKKSCKFYSDYGRYSYFNGRNIIPDQPIHDDTWGEVIMLSGLPGTGKDTWISKHCPEYPVISLDDIRREFRISPTDNQSKVIETARERAREMLRKKQPFVWNATNLSTMIRQRQIGLFTDYSAGTQIIYLETDWSEQLRRNKNRTAQVPEQAICHMMEHLTPPEVWEAQQVSWLCR